MKKFTILLALLCVSLITKAAVRTWNGAGVGGNTTKLNFNLNTNWAGNVTPVAGDDVVMNLATINATVLYIDLSAAISIRHLTITLTGTTTSSSKIYVRTNGRTFSITGDVSITNNSIAASVAQYNAVGLASNVVVTTGNIALSGNFSSVANGTYGYIENFFDAPVSVSGTWTQSMNATKSGLSYTYINSTLTIAGKTTFTNLATLSTENLIFFRVGNSPAVLNLNGDVDFGVATSTSSTGLSGYDGTTAYTGTVVFRGTNINFGTQGRTSTGPIVENFEFDGTGTQNLTVNNTTGVVTCRNLTIGNINNPTVIVIEASTANPSIRTSATSTNTVTIKAGATLDLTTHTLNRNNTTNTGTIVLNGTLKMSGASNFPANFTAFSFANTSTTEYNGTVAQAISTLPSTAGYGNITLSSSGTKTLAAGSTYLKGNLTVISGTPVDFTTNSPVLDFMGNTAQSTSGAYTIYGINISNTGLLTGLTLNNMVSVTNSVSFTGATGSALTSKLIANGNLTLLSTAASTAYLGNQGIFTVAGNVVVERHIDNTLTRRWHLLSPPVTGQTIYNGWQEGGADNASYGTFITNPAVYNNSSTNDAITGFDRVSTNLAVNSATSLRGITTLGTLVNLTNTNATLINTHPAWFLFIRSARPAGTYDNSLTSSTTLRNTGLLNQGTYNVVIPSGTGVVTLPNPYASPVNISGSVLPSTNGINRRFYAWDPGYGGALGGYKLYTDNNTLATGGAFPSTMNELQSNQAIFLVRGTSGVTATFNESDKTTSVYGNVLRNNAASSLNNSIIIRLQSLNETSTLTERDITYAEFNTAYNNGFIGGEDVPKLGNFNENLSLKRDGQWIAMEGMKQPTTNDTLYVQLWKTSAQPYKFEIETNGLLNGLQPYLIDNFTGIQTPLDAAGISIYDFVSNGANVDIDRFNIVFRPSGILPVSITNIKAHKQNYGVAIEWNVSNEAGIISYEVERSADGIIFTKLVSVNATNAAITHSYNAFDATPVTGVNYYRIKSVNTNGSVKYTSIARVIFGKDDNASVSVYPNPVKGGVVNVSLSNLAKGSYTLTIFSDDGKQVATKNITITGNAIINETLRLPQGTGKGIYQLKTSGSTNFIQQIIVE